MMRVGRHGLDEEVAVTFGRGDAAYKEKVGPQERKELCGMRRGAVTEKR